MTIVTVVLGAGVAVGGAGGLDGLVYAGPLSLVQEYNTRDISRKLVKFFIKLGLSEFPKLSRATCFSCC